MDQQTPKPMAYLVRVATGGQTGTWVIFDAERSLHGECGESRRALQIRWRRAGTACPLIQRRREVVDGAELEAFMAAQRRQLARGTVQYVPDYFQECCAAVRQRTVSTGYQHPGRELACRLGTAKPSDVSEADWSDEVLGLRRLIDQGDHTAALAWLEARFPACMALIPQRRRKAFLRGVYSGIARGH